MKKHFYSIVIATALLLGTTAQANHQNGMPHRASEIIGKEVINSADEKIGKIDDLVVDLSPGGKSYVILSIGGLFGVGDQLVVVPASRFDYQQDKKKLVLDVDKERLKTAPTFDKNSMPDWNDPAWNSTLENYYGVSPSMRTAIDASGNKVKAEVNANDPANRNQSVDGPNPLVDTQRTMEIRRQLQASNLSESAKNVQVTSENGSVTLNGTVQSEKERQELIAKVREITGNARVVDQLRIANN